MKFSSYTQFMSDFQQKGIEYAADHAKSCGFEGVEFIDMDTMSKSILVDRFSAKEIKSVLKKHQLQVVCYSAVTDLVNCNDADFDYKIKRVIDFAAELGVSQFHHTILPKHKSQDRKTYSYENIFEIVVERACKLADYCKSKSITVLYEPQGYYFNGVCGLGRLFQAVKSNCDNVGFCADTANSCFVDENSIDVFKAFQQDIKHVHIKNFGYSEKAQKCRKCYHSLGGISFCETALLGGFIDIKQCLSVIKASGYDGFFSMEYLADDTDTIKDMSELTNIWNEI